MRFLDRVLGLPQALTSLENPAVPLSSASIVEYLNITPTASGVSVNEKTALGVSAVWRSVNLIAGVGASLPLHAYSKVRGPDGQVRRVERTSGQAHDLLADPHPDMTPFELWQLVYAHRALWGNAYSQKLRDQTGVVRELWPIHPSMVTPGRAKDRTKVYQIEGYEEGFTDREILHIPGFGYDGVCGLSPIKAHRQALGLALAAEEFGGKLFGSGSLAAGILQTDARLTQEQADVLQKRWSAKVGGGNANAHQVAVLDSGAKFQQLTIPPEDAQFLQSRSFQVEEVARIYGVPPHMLMSLEKSTSWGTGIEQQTLGWVRFSLAPSHLTPVEQRLTKMVRPEPVYVRYTLEGLLRGDSTARKEFYTALWGLGVLSTNEIRAFEDMEPVDGGDVRYRPLNYGLLGSFDTTQAGVGQQP